MPSQFDRHRSSHSTSFSHSRRAGKLKSIMVPAGKFCALVICSALLSVWLQQQWVGGEGRTRNGAFRHYGRKAPSQTESGDNGLDPSDPALSSVGKMEDLYRKHLEEILHTLRANPSVRMVKLTLPNVILNYQRNLASLDDGSTLRLQARSTEIPVLAISSSARRFLEQMLITYVDPKTLPPRVIDSTTLPFNPKMLPQFLLVPDLSGTNASQFTFEKR